jgi:hypothetical protein
MIRITTLLWIALLVVAGGTVMHVSYQVRHVEKHISELARDTHSEEDAIRILNAEWDSLNDPHRIDELSKRHLSLQPTPIARVVSLEAIPLKLSDEQVAKLAIASAKTTKGQAGASQIAQKKPDVTIGAAVHDGTPLSVTAAAARAPSGQTPLPKDGLGTLLARVDRH